MNSYQATAIRMTNAENKFIEAVQEQFGKSKEEAEIILSVFKREKIIKIDAIIGQFKLISGIFWDAQVMNNAIEQA